jgi:raffinose/stachyose/melibiose transport system permease protein
MHKFFRNGKVIAALVVPGLAVLVFAIFVPIGYSVYYSLTDWTGFGTPNAVGLDNYVNILTNDPVFWTSLVNALWLVLATVFLQNPVAFILAAVLSKLSSKWSQTLRTLFFVPAVLSVVVITALWVNILNPNFGLLNKALELVGLKALALSWLSDPNTALGAVIWIITWAGFGWALLFYYTGLMTVPTELNEAAAIDGANAWQKYTKVVVPAMMPTISAVIVIDVISCLKQMEVIFLSTQGGPGQTTQFIAVYLYQKAFSASEYGYGNALSVLFVVVAIGLTLLVQRLLKTEEVQG